MTGGKEKFGDIDFAFNILIGNPVAILVGKGKWLYFIYQGQSLFSKTRDEFCKHKIKSENQSKEKQ